ncbi:DEAD/DEAH box helicase [Natrialbaceae archaeon A-CW2]
MTLNPLQFAEEVNKQYLRYQLTSARLADKDLGDQFQNKIWGSNSPLFKGPFVSLSRAYKEGSSVESLVNEDLLHKRMRTIVPYPNLYEHQEQALRAIKGGKDTLVTTGTGSGKTESFLYPIIDRCLHLEEDPQAPNGVTAVIVYPMNALAADQLERLRELLVGTGVSFGRYVGPTPEDESRLDFEGIPLAEDTSRVDFRELREDVDHDENTVHLPSEERYTREQIREDPPRILLVNKAILEFQLTRGRDLDLFLDAPLEYVVMDEAHTNTGAQGSEVALLLRRLKELADPPKGYVSNIATSATIVDDEHDDEGQRFMARLFGVDEDNVAIVRESYQGIDWPDNRRSTSLPPNAKNLFQRTLEAIAMDDDPDRDAELAALFHELTGYALPEGETIEERLFDGLLENDFAYQLHYFGNTVRSLDDLVDEVWTASSDRALKERGAREEVLTYLVLGAAAEKEDTPLFRPKLHYFVKGLEGAVVVLDKGDEKRPAKPTLFLNADEATKRYEGRRDETAFFPVKVCPQCGQHHYEQYVTDTTSRPGDELTGGHQMHNGTFFPADNTQTDTRVLFTDTIVHSEDDSWDGGGTSKHSEGAVCYNCGTIHKGDPSECGTCEREGTLLPVYILESVDEVSSCPVCRYTQGHANSFYDDPFRALREVTVANVYVLAQDMLNQADENGKRLITFTDNRQEAAFQAGWMQDRARRYRFRRLLYNHLKEDPEGQADERADISLTSVVDDLTETLYEDRSRAKVIAPEVFEEHVDSTYDTKFKDALQRYLTIQVLREVTETYNTRASLESWGKLRVHYWGVDNDNSEIIKLANRYGLETDELVSWLRNLLDTARKRKMLLHKREPIFQHTWDKRNDLVKNRYLPPIDFYPSGMRLQRSKNQESNSNVKVWLGKSRTAIQDWAYRLDLPKEEADHFLKEVWELLEHDLELLQRLDSLKYGGSGDSIKGTQNVYQVDAHKIGITRQDERYRCEFCGRIHPRDTPNDACTRWRCEDGRLELMEDEEPKDYDLVALEEADTFVMAEEHTAQVPNKQRDRIERAFKEGEGVNCLVATPTLELGVDIGALDMVLLRNVPPRPANYWQRAGRAGRRNRMAIIYTYVRSNPHDLHFFNAPEDLLGGAVRPPSFNLRNPVMIEKHVHAAVLTQLHAELLDREDNWIREVIPQRIGEVVFEEGKPRSELEPVVEPLRDALEDRDRKERLLDVMESTFATNWPDDPEDVSREQLEKYVNGMPDALVETYRRVLRRLEWAWEQRQRLAQKEAQGEMLSDEEERFKDRCQSTINTLRPNYSGNDDSDSAYRTYTLSVLSREGFLPGYATSRGNVVASAERAYSRGWDKFEFDVNRPNSVAIREHIPGNRIYANGGKYQLRYYKFPATEEVQNPREWHVSPERFKVQNKDEAEVGYNDPQATDVTSLPLVDSQLSFISHVEDLENTRFRMPSAIAGVLRSRHDGGNRYEFGNQVVEHRENQFVTLLNFGPEQEDRDELGFPICVVCGGVRSPYESDDAIEQFVEYHEDHCGETPQHHALHVHTDVDGLLFKNIESQAEAVSLGEGLTLLGSHLFDMERDDLQWLPIPVGEEDWELFLFDPMPGGSGLLEQFIDEWDDVVEAARDILGGCPSACLTSCYDCLRTYYNQVHHEILDRYKALDFIESMTDIPTSSNVIEPIDEVPDIGAADEDTNLWEKQLEDIITNEWGYSQFSPQVKIDLPSIGTHTKPDLAHEDAKIAIYLDGPHHFEEDQRQKDNMLRQALKTDGWTVIEIQIQDFENDMMMDMYRKQISNTLT